MTYLMAATYDIISDHEPPSKFLNSYLVALYITKTKKQFIWVYFERMYYFPRKNILTGKVDET